MAAESIATRQVLQRTEEGLASVEVMGGIVVTDVAGAVVAKAEGAGTVAIPVGGPYVVTGDGAVGGRAEHVLVGDLWVLAGQSNMQGTARLDRSRDEAGPLVGLLDMARTWREPVEPLHVLSSSPDVCHRGDTPEAEAIVRMWDTDFAHLGAGLGLPFANALVEATGVPVGLVATAHGGTSLDQWSPEAVAAQGASLHWSMLASVEAAGGRVAGVLWYQGESDATPEFAGSYADRFTAWVADVRDRLGAELPVYVVQLGRLVVDDPVGFEHWELVRAAQLAYRACGATGMVTAIDLPLDDPIHISTEGLTRLGRRFAHLVAGTATAPEPLTVELLDDRGPWLRVAIGGVNGGLLPTSHLGGFSVRAADGTSPAVLYDARVDPADGASVLIGISRMPAAGETLWYGAGLDPAATVVDRDDMALPAFGPVPLPTSIGERVDVQIPGRLHSGG